MALRKMGFLLWEATVLIVMLLLAFQVSSRTLLENANSKPFVFGMSAWPIIINFIFHCIHIEREKESYFCKVVFELRIWLRKMKK